VACSEQDAAICLVLPDDVGDGGGGQDGVLSDYEFCDAIGRSDLEDRLDGLWGEVAAVSTNDQGRPFGIDRVEDGLDEIFGVVLVDGEYAVNKTRARSLHLLLEHFDPARRVSSRTKEKNEMVDLFLRPEVPGFWPSKGFVGISWILWDMEVKVKFKKTWSRFIS
jgi:hypothetical protein